MGILVWLIVGGVVGWLASIVMRTDAQQGILLNVVVGIVGALLAGLHRVAAAGHRHDQPGHLDRDVPGVAGGRDHPAGDRQPVPSRPGPLTSAVR